MLESVPGGWRVQTLLWSCELFVELNADSVVLRCTKVDLGGVVGEARERALLLLLLFLDLVLAVEAQV